MTKEEIFQAIGRAYAHADNENKEFDHTLAETIADEIMKINVTHQLYGWVCPVCKCGQSPFSNKCFCKSPYISGAQI